VPDVHRAVDGGEGGEEDGEGRARRRTQRREDVDRAQAEGEGDHHGEQVLAGADPRLAVHEGGVEHV
jgi:hypothetical protein